MKQKNAGEPNIPFIYKIWEIGSPFIIYYLVYSAAFLLMTFLCRAVAEGLGTEYLTYTMEHAETVTGLVGGVSMIVAVMPLLPMLRRELSAHRLLACGMEKRTNGYVSQGDKHSAGVARSVLSVVLTIVLAAASSVGFNILLALTGLVQSSVSYQDVAKQQYGVVFGVGMVLFGLISPVTEEIVFRGLIFNRLRRYCPHAVAVVASGVLFGAYHGNLVQGLYGSCMGILMAYLYERMHSFVIPCLFHATANLVVYMVAHSGTLHGRIFNVPGCVILLGVTVVCIVVVEKIWRSKGILSKSGG